MQQSTSFELDSIGNRDDGRMRERNNRPGRRWTRERRRHNNYFEPQASEGDKVTSSEEFALMQQSTSFDLDSIGNRDDGRRSERNNQPGRRWTMERRRHNNYFDPEHSKPSAMEGSKI
jgi:hypothetical protein